MMLREIAIITAILAVTIQALEASSIEVETAVLAGGCFWCMEAQLERIRGVLGATAGYCGGHLENPTYSQVTRGDSGHYEVVKVEFEPSTVTFRRT